jgi:hypothetical protein
MNQNEIIGVAKPLSNMLQCQVKHYGPNGGQYAKYPTDILTQEMWLEYVKQVQWSDSFALPFQTTRVEFLKVMLPICKDNGIVAWPTDLPGVPGGDYTLPGYRGSVPAPNTAAG